MFEDLMNDKVEIIKKDGKVIKNLKANCQNSKIFIPNGNIVIEKGDVINRLCSNGAEESYTVIKPNFQEGIAGIPSHYQCEVKDKDDESDKKEIKQVNNTTYNISGPAQIGDNNQQVINELKGLMNKIDNSSYTTTEKEKAKSLLKEVFENKIILNVMPDIVKKMIGVL